MHKKNNLEAPLCIKLKVEFAKTSCEKIAEQASNPNRIQRLRKNAFGNSVNCEEDTSSSLANLEPKSHSKNQKNETL